MLLFLSSLHVAQNQDQQKRYTLQPQTGNRVEWQGKQGVAPGVRVSVCAMKVQDPF